MDQLNYASLRASGYAGFMLERGTEKVMQFGEGNFLRAFADAFIDIANERAGYGGKVVLVQPIAQGLTEIINRQQGLYTLYLRGSEKGARVDEKRVISCVSRCVNPYEDWDAVLSLARSAELELVISNTTEAGIVYDADSAFDQAPPASFPAKLTRVLYERFTSGLGGLTILSCELIDDNGKQLRRCVERHIADWGLPEAFARWVAEENVFCSTLVDRIVPGRVRDAAEAAAMDAANGYHDALMDVGECFGVWVIEGPAGLEDRLPFKAAGVPVMVVPDVTPYKKRKVRILNGAHTGFVPGAYLAGFDIVRDCMRDPVILGFMNRMLYEEVIPTLPLDRADCEAFAASVQDRFNNPFVDHALLSIALNSTSKWRARCMPTLLDYVSANAVLPRCLTTSLAALIAFYTNEPQSMEDGRCICRRGGGAEYPVVDDAWVLDFFWAHRNDDADALTRAVLSNARMWGQDLTNVPGLEAETARVLRRIRADGARAAFGDCLV